MEQSENVYSLFVVYRYMRIDVIINKFYYCCFIQTCLRSCSALHRLSNMFGIEYSDLLQWRSI